MESGWRSSRFWWVHCSCCAKGVSGSTRLHRVCLSYAPSPDEGSPGTRESFPSARGASCCSQESALIPAGHAYGLQEIHVAQGALEEIERTEPHPRLEDGSTNEVEGTRQVQKQQLAVVEPLKLLRRREKSFQPVAVFSELQRGGEDLHGIPRESALLILPARSP